DFGVFVERAFGAAFGVKTEVAGFDAIGVDKLAFVGFEVFAILAMTKAGRVIGVVVKDGADGLVEVRGIGCLHDHVVIDLGCVMGVPNHDGENLGGTS